MRKCGEAIEVVGLVIVRELVFEVGIWREI
jgi:hypothetical protein